MASGEKDMNRENVRKGESEFEGIKDRWRCEETGRAHLQEKEAADSVIDSEEYSDGRGEEKQKVSNPSLW